jgi:acyl-CoA synthetase (NDP forming)
MRHRLDPLLRPRSIAVVGATPKLGSYGREVMLGCLSTGFPGRVFLVNPGYTEIEGNQCYPDLRALPEVPDHAILAVANPRIEAAVEDAIGAGVKAATIFASCMIDEPKSPELRERIRRRAVESGLMICGANGTGFYNRVDRARCQMSGGPAEEPGNVSLIVQSGSVLSALVSTDRLRFNFTVSTGQEITTSVADYMEFALSLESTRAIGLYIETIRNPAGFVAQLERAAKAGVAVVIVKLGRSEKSREFALSHTGAIAGNIQAYEAVFEHYGAQCVDDPDELVAALQLFSTGKRPGPGKGLVAILDSGGERELLADMADRKNVPFAEIGDETKVKLAARLDFGLEAENPLDAWGTGHGFETLFEACLGDLLNDPEAGVGLWVADLRDGESYHERYAESAMRLAATRDKPLAFATCYARCRNGRLAVQLRDAGVPVLEGMRASMAAVRSMMNHSAFLARPKSNPPVPDAAVVKQWQTRLIAGSALDEATALSLLADFGVSVAGHRIVEKRDEVRGAADAVGYPVALKTAAPGIQHKSDVGGVKLALQTPDALVAAYDEMSGRLGPRVIVAAMVPRGVELSFGLLQDPDFGPIVMIGAGGTMIELLKDAAFAVPPVDAATARRLIDRLQIRRLLDGWRGDPAADLDALSLAFARFSALVAALGNDLAEIDVNPIIAGPDGVTAVDALIIPRAAAGRQNEQE